MISFIRGELAEKDENGIVVEASGVGYYISAPLSVIGNLPPVGSEVKLYTYMKVADDGISLYGFSDREERRVFERLISVNGVGPKAGMSILSSLSVRELAMAIVTDDEKAISRAPGVGAKTTKRIIMELKDLFDAGDLVGGAAITDIVPDETALSGSGDIGSEALLALVALGYSKAEAVRALSNVKYDENSDISDVIAQTLRYL